MFFGTGYLWFFIGILFVVVALAFKAFADDRGWRLNWWKGLLALIWYAIFGVTIFAFGTLIGENESIAAIYTLLFGLFILLILGVGLWRLISYKPQTEKVTE